MPLFLLIIFLFSAHVQAYYGRNATEANLSFEATIDVPWTSSPPTLTQLNSAGPTQEQALKLVHNQILHLDGNFHSEAFAKKWGGPASCGPWYEPGTYNIKFLGVDTHAPQGRLQLKYTFSAKIVVQKDPLRRRESAKMDVWLPYAPDLIYDLGMKRGKNQCTDREDNVKENFYYYWDPYQPGCPLLKEHPESIQWITAKVDRLPNTKLTYPNYSELYKDSEKKPKLQIAMFWGYISHAEKGKKPFYRDDSYRAMKAILQNLREAGFTSSESHPHFHVTKEGNVVDTDGANVLEKMTKTIQRNGRNLTIELLLLLSDTSLDTKDPTFHSYLKPAINNADIFIYDGHSGDGDYLSPEKVGIPAQTAAKYQIFFINGCDSYMNYLQQFVKARGGLNKLDLVLSSTPTLSDAAIGNDWTFLEPFVNLKTQSYQFMLDKLEKSNGDSGTFLVGVVGDEKDVWKP